MTFESSSYKQDGVRACWAATETTDSGWYRSHVVATPFGYVSVYTQGDDKSPGYSMLQFIRDGRAFERRFNYSMTPRAAAVQAGKLARHVVFVELPS